MGEGGWEETATVSVSLYSLGRKFLIYCHSASLSLSLHRRWGGGRHRHAHAPICAHGREGVRKRCLLLLHYTSDVKRFQNRIFCPLLLLSSTLTLRDL